MSLSQDIHRDPPQSFGDHLRDWRARRRLSQLDLALEANVSARHVSFLETGRARPSREMVLQLATTLDLPLRERNSLLQAAGFVAAYPERPLDHESLKPIRAALTRMLAQHMPFPAMLLDKYWTVLDANPMAAALFNLGPALASGSDGGAPVNVLEMIAAHPEITAQFENWPEVAQHLMARLRLEAAASGGDPKLQDLIDGLAEDPAFALPAPAQEIGAQEAGQPFLCSRIRMGDQVIALFSTIAQFGTAQDITVHDLRLELFFPADETTETMLADFAARLAD